MRKNILFLIFVSIFLIGFISAAGTTVRLADHGTDVRNSTNVVIESGNISIFIYDAESGGNEIFNQTFTDGIVNGSWNVILVADMEYGKTYWKDYQINGEDLDFSGNERLQFMSPLGYINNATLFNFSLIDSCSSGQAIKQIYENGSVECVDVSSDLSNYALKNQSETFSGNITTTQYGFFGYLGSLASRITKIFATNLDVSGDTNLSGNLILNGTSIDDWSDVNFSSEGSTDTTWNITGSEYLYNNSGTLEINETKLNNTINANSDSLWVNSSGDATFTSGNVGIGLANPSHLLQLKSPSLSTNVFSIIQSATSDTLFRILEGSTGAGNLYIGDGSGVDSVRIAGGTSATYFLGSGNFGIGTSSPSQKLDVNGSVNVGDSIVLNGTSISDWNDLEDFSWNITSSTYLYNNSGTLEVNETKLNESIVLAGVIYNDTLKIDSLNSTKLENGTNVWFDSVGIGTDTLGAGYVFDITGDARINGNLTVIGDIVYGTSNNTIFNASIYPEQDAIYDVGNSTNRWRNATFAGTINTADILVDSKNVLLEDGTNWNYTLMNETIDARTNLSNVNSSYLYVTNKLIYLNETKLNETIDSLDNDTLYYADGVYLYNNGSNWFYLNETKLNETIAASSLWTNSSGSATFTSGNVGVGTTDPTNKLDVNGGVSLNDTLYVDGGRVIIGNESTSFTSPLVVDKNIGPGGSLIRVYSDNTQLTTGTTRGIELGIVSSTAGIGSIIGGSFYASNSYSGDTGTVTGITSTVTGASTSSDSVMGVNSYVENNNGSGPYYGYYAQAGSSSTTGTGYAYYVSDADFDYGIYSAGAGKNYFGGNVGIGTTNPTSKLHVDSSGVSQGGSALYGLQSTISTSSSGTGSIEGAYFTASNTYNGDTGLVRGILSSAYGNSNSGDLVVGISSTVENDQGSGPFYGFYAFAGNSSTTGTGYGYYVDDTDFDYGIYSAGAANNYFEGNVGIGTTSPTSLLNIKTNSLPVSNHESMVRLHNPAGTLDVAMGIYNPSGSYGGYLWLGDTGVGGEGHYIYNDDGVLEITSGVSNLYDNTGVIVGAQTSSLDMKNLILEKNDTGAALDLISNTPVYEFQYKDGRYNNETFVGIVTDYSPEFGMDKDENHTGGKSFNAVSSFGYTVLAIQELKSENDALKATLCDMGRSEWC